VLQADRVAVFGLVAVVLCWMLAVVLFRSGAKGSIARRLSLLLAVEGVALGSSGILDFFLTPEVRAGSGYLHWMQVSFVLHTVGDGAMLALYPLFLAAVLDTPLVRPLARPKVRRTLMSAAVLLVPVVWFTPLIVGGVVLYVVMASLFGFALVASIHAWRVAPRGLARARAGTLALAFGFRDVCWGLCYAFGIGQILAGTAADPSAWPDVFYVAYASGTLFAVPVIAYGILRTQLFDIDLRLRWTIKQSTLAGAFVASLYLVTEGTEQLLSSELGTMAGLLVAAALVFFLAPLQRLAERVASAAMPHTRDTPEYVAFRKLQVYEAALMDATRDGGITEKERALLHRLRDALGVDHADAAALERDLADRMGGLGAGAHLSGPPPKDVMIADAVGRERH
jgi:hypothetical protein